MVSTYRKFRTAVRRSTGISWFRLASEVLRCNMAGLWPPLLRLTGIRPLYANFWRTTRCSGQCRTCTEWEETDHEELTTAEYKTILASLYERGVRIVYFFGGDVFLRDDLFELVEYATDIGLRVHMTINAFTVTEETARALMATGISSVHLSLDMLGDGLDDVRGISDASATVLRSLGYLGRHNRHGTELGITATIMKYTLPSIRTIVDFAIANNLTVYFNLINFTHHFFQTAFSRDQYHLSRDERKELSDLVQWLTEKQREYPGLLPRRAHLEWIDAYFDNFRTPWPPCYQTLLKVCVRANGDVRPCCSMETVGNVRRNDLATIVASDRYRALLTKALTKTCPGCSCRYTLNLDVSLRSHLRELFHRQENR